MNIVLVHGLLAFREKFGIEYFWGVAEHFREKGIRVHVPQLDPTRGIEFRGDQLRDQITAAFATGVLDENQKTHIIAHSMGGLDSRYILSPANPNGIQKPISSLTTISTPHLGSPIADILDAPAALLPFPHLPFNPPGNPLEGALNKLGISLDGLRDLTSDRCRAFSMKYENRPVVAYFSVAGSGRPAFSQTAAAFLLFYQYIWGLTGQPNDGLVTTVSARWGTFDPETWRADHADEVGHNLDNLIVPPAFPYLAKYDQIVANVANLWKYGCRLLRCSAFRAAKD
jgi:triacylglycerol lipase